jgi:hypothetical protein
MVGWCVVLPPFPEGEVDIQDGRPVNLQLQVVPRRSAPVARVDPDRIRVAPVVGAVSAAAGQVDPAHEGDAAPRIVRPVDDQELLVVAAESAHPLVGYQLPAGSVDQRAQHPVGVLVEAHQGRVGTPQQPADGHAAAGQPGQQRAEFGARAGQLAGGVDAPVGQVHPVSSGEAGEQLVQPGEVRSPVDVHRHLIAERPGPSIRVLDVNGRRRVAPLLRGQQPVHGGVRFTEYRRAHRCPRS